MNSKIDGDLKQYNIKQLNVNLKRHNFSKIRIRCSATSSSGEELFSDLRQDGLSTFTLKITRRKYDDIRDENEISDFLHPQKKLKCIATDLRDDLSIDQGKPTTLNIIILLNK